MGTLFRSEEMALCELYIQSDAAYNCVSELGELGVVQFRDLNADVSAFQRKFVTEIRRCDEMERKLRFLEKEMKRDEIPIFDPGENPEAPQAKEMIELEGTFEKLEAEMKEINVNTEALKKNYVELTELKHVLRQTQNFFDEAMGPMDGGRIEDRLGLLGEEVVPGGAGAQARLGFVAGVIHRERIAAFERLLWRVCRGNVFVRHTPIDVILEDPITGQSVYKNVFIIFFQGEQLKTRVKKICEGFHATLYPCPETKEERRQMTIGIMSRIEDLNTVLAQTQKHREKVLVATAKEVKTWSVKVRKMKAIYHAMNQFNIDVTSKCLVAECWCPVNEIDRIRIALRRGTEASGGNISSILNRIQTHMVPPTYFRTNKFTAAFQGIVDAYGVASYREVNPAPYTIITFPFLFGVMFGDAGHGLIMFLFALWMVLREKQLRVQMASSEIFGMVFGGRYLILLMGAFSIYCGIVYNDIFARSANIFGSAWKSNYNKSATLDGPDTAAYMLDPATSAYEGLPYAIGIDPVWNLAENKIIFINSMKMKLSVILGVSQMVFGTVLSIFNHLYSNKLVNVFCEFIPQILFLCSIFVYMDILIIWKWIVVTPAEAGCAPSILMGVINMVMFSYPTTPCATDLFRLSLKGLQSFLVILAAITVPWLLLAKPLYIRHRMKRRAEMGGVTNGSVAGPSEVLEGQDPELQSLHKPEPAPHSEEDEEFSEIFIHQCIHTIEYVLGAVSHTASYLRLWALSLAHSQLSEVLWTMVFRIPLGMGWPLGGIIMVPVFTAWAVLTVAILLVMEGVSAFLHALRLHWVEFNSKFFKGEGHAFISFSFEAILAESAT